MNRFEGSRTCDGCGAQIELSGRCNYCGSATPAMVPVWSALAAIGEDLGEIKRNTARTAIATERTADATAQVAHLGGCGPSPGTSSSGDEPSDFAAASGCVALAVLAGALTYVGWNLSWISLLLLLGLGAVIPSGLLVAGIDYVEKRIRGSA